MSLLERINVPIPGHPYDIALGTNLGADLPELLRAECPAANYVVISDEKVAALHGDALLTQVRELAPTKMITFPAGELSKSRAEWTRITDLMIADHVGRDTAIIALGGGVTGDLAGFIAATYMRGLDLVHIPTSLLAMVDSSIGGKTGVNTDRGKNLVGAFHQPKAVVIDTAYLLTLPPRHLRAGMAEALKHGVIADAAYFRETVEVADDILAGNPDSLARVIRQSLVIKAEVVARDEREAGRRAILNFGHTVGHAIEICSRYQLLHGEALAIGMVSEAQLSEQVGISERGLADVVMAGIERFGLSTRLPVYPPGSLMAAMMSDKKNQSAKLRFSLPDQLGSIHRAKSGSWTVEPDESVTKLHFGSTS